MKKYALFIKDNCPFCVSALELLQERQLEYSIVNVDDNLLLAQQVKDTFSWNTFPVVLEQESSSFKLIGGFTDLENTLTDNG